MEEIKIYAWDMEQLRTLASLADFRPELRDAMINIGKKIIDGIEPAGKKAAVIPGEKMSMNDYAKNPLILTRDEVERLKFIERMMILPGIESGYVRVEGGSSYTIPPEYVIKISNPLNAGPPVAAENKPKELAKDPVKEPMPVSQKRSADVENLSVLPEASAWVHTA
jgi:hypothetical protein